MNKNFYELNKKKVTALKPSEVPLFSGFLKQ